MHPLPLSVAPSGPGGADRPPRRGPGKGGAPPGLGAYRSGQDRRDPHRRAALWALEGDEGLLRHGQDHAAAGGGRDAGEDRRGKWNRRGRASFPGGGAAGQGQDLPQPCRGGLHLLPRGSLPLCARLRDQGRKLRGGGEPPGEPGCAPRERPRRGSGGTGLPLRAEPRRGPAGGPGGGRLQPRLQSPELSPPLFPGSSRPPGHPDRRRGPQPLRAGPRIVLAGDRSA